MSNSYTYTKTAINASLLQAEADAAITPAKLCDGIHCDGVDVYLYTDVVLDGTQETALATAVDDHDPCPLSLLISNLSVDAYTFYQGQMYVGFTHDNKSFPLTSSAIADWSSLNQSRADVTYPVIIPSANGTKYSIADAATVTTMFDLAVNTGKALVEAYSNALDLIVTAATKTAAQTAYDNYIGA